MKEKERIEYERFETLPSTNDHAKAKRNEGRELIVIAKRQTGGRGTKGRSFSSEEGGLYLSKLTFYKGLPAKQAFKIMQGAAAAVCETLAGFGFAPKIKWPNDVYVNGKKICGILIENAFSGGYVSSSVVGIGLNVHNELPEALFEVATTMKAETDRVFSVDEVETALTGYLEREDIHEKYAGYLGWLGAEVTLISGEEKLPVKIISVEEDGGLVVQTRSGERKVFVAAEVTLRLKGERV